MNCATEPVRRRSIGFSAAYHKGVTGNIPKAIEACDLWMQDYPRSELPHVYLGAAVLPVVGQYERAVEESTEGVRLRPDFPLAYAFRIRAYTASNRFDEAKATYAEALERKLHAPYIDLRMYTLAFAQNDPAAMAQHATKLEALPGVGHQILSMEGDTAAYSGHLKDARELSRRAIDPRPTRRREGCACTLLWHLRTERSLVRQYGRSAAACRFGIEALERPRSAVFCSARVCLHQG